MVACWVAERFPQSGPCGHCPEFGKNTDRVQKTALAPSGPNSQNSPNGPSGVAMKSMSAKEAKNAFGLLLDTARAEPVNIVKHGRRVAVIVSAEEYDRLVDERSHPGAVKKGADRKKNEGG